MKITIKLDISKPIDDQSRLTVRPQLTDEEMEKARGYAKDVDMDLATFLINLNVVVSKTFNMVLGQNENLTFDSLLEAVKGFIERDKNERPED